MGSMDYGTNRPPCQMANPAVVRRRVVSRAAPRLDLLGLRWPKPKGERLRSGLLLQLFQFRDECLWAARFIAEFSQLLAIGIKNNDCWIPCHAILGLQGRICFLLRLGLRLRARKV